MSADCAVQPLAVHFHTDAAQAIRVCPAGQPDGLSGDGGELLPQRLLLLLRHFHSCHGARLQDIVILIVPPFIAAQAARQKPDGSGLAEDLHKIQHIGVYLPGKGLIQQSCALGLGYGRAAENILILRCACQQLCGSAKLGQQLAVQFLAARQLIERFAVKVPNGEYPLGTLSGGNIQKVILARELDADPEILIAAQPTRGVDIGAIEYIRKQLVALRDSGKAILLVSAELEEILSLSDRIIVMYEGEIVGTFRPEETTEEELGLYMTGSRRMELDGGAL